MWRTKAFPINKYKDINAWSWAIQRYMNKHVSNDVGYHISFDNDILIVIHKLKVSPSWGKHDMARREMDTI